jgi:hypothetical protein
MVLVLSIVLALIIGWATGGSIMNVTRVHFRWLPVVVVAALIQVLIFTPILGREELIHRAGPYIYIGTVLATLTVILLNRHIPGMKIVAIGAALNALVIIANGGFMPSPASELHNAGKLTKVESTEQTPGSDYVLSNSVIADDDTRLRFLGDVMSIPRGIPMANVISIGDIVLALGIAVTVLRVMHMRKGPDAERSAQQTVVRAPGPGQG